MLRPVIPFLTAICVVSILLLSACSGTPEEQIQKKIDELMASHEGATVAVSVRDLGSDFVFNHNGQRLMHAASTMKVPVMMEVYKQAAANGIGLADTVIVHNKFSSIVDRSPYSLRVEDDSDKEIYDLIGQPLTVRNLVERMITHSSNLATNIVIEMVGADKAQQSIRQLGASRMKVLRGVEDLVAFRKGLNNEATSEDLAIVMEAIAREEWVSSESSDEMLEILARQEHNEMIPAGLPPGTRVAHKTGQITAIHHDAAVVYPTGSDPYVLVVMVEGVTPDTVSARIGSEITTAVHQAIR